MSTITLKFTDVTNTIIGMQTTGTQVPEGEGFSVQELQDTFDRLTKQGNVCEWIEVKGAVVLVVRGAILPFQRDALLEELESLTFDRQVKMYGRVVSRKSHHSLCFTDVSQAAEVEEGKGTIVDFQGVPMVNALRQALPKLLGPKATGLLADGNHYYDLSECYMGFHGDSERRKVVGVRLGVSMPMHLQPYRNYKPVGPRVEIMLHHGDLYVLSEKAVGTDYRKKKRLTIRRASGFKEVLERKTNKKLHSTTTTKSTNMGRRLHPRPVVVARILSRRHRRPAAIEADRKRRHM